MSDTKSSKEGADAAKEAKDPPKDAGRPFVFAAAQNVEAAKEIGKGQSSAETASPADRKRKAGGDAAGVAPGGASAGGASAQIPMELMHLQRSQSIMRASREAAGGSSAGAASGAAAAARKGAAEGGTGNSSSSAGAPGDSGKRRSSRAIKRKRFDDEIVDTASSIAPPGCSNVPGGSAHAAPSSSVVEPAETSSSSQGPFPARPPPPPAPATLASSPHAAAKPPSSATTPTVAHNLPPGGARGPSITLPGIPQPKPEGPKTPSSATTPPAVASTSSLGKGNKGSKGSKGGKGGPSKPSPSSSKLSRDKGAGKKLSKNRGSGGGASGGATALSEWDPSLANSRAALKKNKSNKKTKRAKREGAWKDLSRWKPTDDLALITAVMQTHDLASVYRGVKFSCHFTMSEVQERWFALMYEPIISKMAVQAIKNLHPEVVLAVQRRTLFSKDEQDVVSTIKATTNPPPTLKDFSDLLKRNPTVFHHARTPRCLAHFWQSLKQYTLLPDQSVQPLPRDNHVLNFLDAEAAINDGELGEERDGDDMTDHELAASDRKVKKEIRHLEAEVAKWQVMVDRVRGEATPDFDNQTLAVLRGRLVRYLMRSKEITIGRSTADHAVDVDLKLEGPAWKISRKQGVIKLNGAGEFHIANEGKRAMFIDGRPITRGHRSRLCNNSVLEIAGLKFVFLINTDFIDAIRQEAMKLYQNS